MSLLNFQDNLELTFDYESKPKDVVGCVISPNSLIWQSSLFDFIEFLPVQYNQFVFAEIGDLNYNLALSFQGDVDNYLPFIYLHVLKECGFHLIESIETNRTLRIINLSDNILSPDSFSKKKRKSIVNENNIVYDNVALGGILYFIRRSNKNISFIFSEGISCKQRINLTLKKFENQDIKEIAQYLNSVGITVEIVEEHPIYTVRKME